MLEKYGGIILEDRPILYRTSKIKVKCNRCSYIWETNFSYLNNGQWCKICRNGTTDMKKNFYIICEKENYTPLSDVESYQGKVKMKCSKGHITKISAGSFVSGVRCLKCRNLCPKQCKEEFEELVKLRGGKIIEEYNGALTKVKVNCGKHNFFVTPSNIKQGMWCNVCFGSSGELLVRKLLIDLGKDFDFQFKFNGNRMRYDFCVENKVMIEVDGLQHFFPVIPKYHKDVNEFIKRRDIDREKFIKCLDKGYRMIRIHYFLISNPKKCKKFLEDSLDSDEKVIFSHKNRYDWLYDKKLDDLIIEKYLHH